MPKIPTFTSTATPTAEVGAVKSNIQVSPNASLAAAIAPAARQIEDYYVKEKQISNQVEGGELIANANQELFEIAETAKSKSTPQKGLDRFEQGYEKVVNKYKLQAGNTYIRKYFELNMANKKTSFSNTILRQTRANMVKTATEQTFERVQNKILTAVESGNNFDLETLSSNTTAEYQNLLDLEMINEQDFKQLKKSLPNQVETAQIRKISRNNAAQAFSILLDTKNFTTIQGDDRRKLLSEFGTLARHQTEIFTSALNTETINKTKEFFDKYKSKETMGFSTEELTNFKISDNEFNDQITQVNEKIVNQKFSFDTNYNTNTDVISKILSGEIKNTKTKFLLAGETESQSILERAGNETINNNDVLFLSNFITRGNNNTFKSQDETFVSFFENLVPLLQGNTFLNYFDKQYNSRASELRQTLHTRYLTKLSEGVPVADLLNFTSENYIAKDIKNYLPKTTDFNSIVESMQPEDTNNTIQRIEGETTTEYLKRIEGNTSSLSLDTKPVLIGLASNDKFFNHILEQEGKPFLTAEKAFADEKYFTLGFGRNNENVKEGETITLKKAKENLQEDIDVRLKEIQIKIPNFSNFSEELQVALFGEYFRGSVGQSINTLKLINANPPRFKEAADEFLDNDEYRDAKERNRGGIRTDMENVARLLRLEGTKKA
tara:strand:- start:2362 stop:4359 length:1998 start_codon:yes stop_codon:yes gene_type:complete